MKDLKTTIGNKILYLRELHGLSQQEFAERLNLSISRGHISNIENGMNMPSAEFIRSVCINFNTSSNWLLDIPDIKYEYDPIMDNYNLLNEEAKDIIKNLINLLLKDT